MVVFQFTWRYIQKYLVQYVLFFLLVFITGLLGLISPIINGKLLDSLVTSKDQSVLIYYLILIGCIGIGNLVLSFFSSILSTLVQTQSGYDLNQYVLDHLNKVSHHFFKDQDTVYLNQRINNDANALTTFFIDILPKIVLSIFTFIFTNILLAKINILIEALLVVILLFYVLLYESFKKPLFNNNIALKEEQALYFAALNEQLHKIKFIKQQALEAFYQIQLRKSFDTLLSKAIIYQKVSYLFNSIDTGINLIVQLFLYLIGGIAVIKGELTIGAFTIVLSYFNAQLSSLRFFLSLGKQYQENLVSYSRMDALLSIPTLDFGSQPLHTIEKIELRSVGFSYDADRKIFSNLSLTLEKGSVYYVKGANGTGKSTLIDILTGLYPNEYGGEIIFNGHINMRELDIKYYQANLLAYLDQDATLMNDSLLNNMTLAKAPSEYLDFYCSAIGLDELIDKLPEGLHATVNNHSKNLSGGERQKISIIRQFVKNAEVLIFDEPTSALDKYSKSRFWNLIESIKVDKIILVITHDKEQTLPQGEVIFLDDSAPHRSHSVS